MRYEVEITAVVYVEAEDAEKAKMLAESQENWDDDEACLIAARTAMSVGEEDEEED